MTKNDLRTGMVVELRNGQRYLVLVGEFTMSAYGKQSIVLISNNEQWNGSVFTDDLRPVGGCKRFDVIKVFNGNVDNLQSTIGTTAEPIWTRQPEVDWSKVAVDTKVYVKESNDSKWIPRYFSGYRGGKVRAWVSGATSFSESIDMPWNYAKLAKEVRQ